jgi:hypothetical protein
MLLCSWVKMSFKGRNDVNNHVNAKRAHSHLPGTKREGFGGVLKDPSSSLSLPLSSSINNIKPQDHTYQNKHSNKQPNNLNQIKMETVKVSFFSFRLDQHLHSPFPTPSPSLHLPPSSNILTFNFQNAANYVAESVQGAGSQASKEANKQVAKDNDASLGSRATAAKDAVGDKFDQTSHNTKADVHKGKPLPSHL